MLTSCQTSLSFSRPLSHKYTWLWVSWASGCPALWCGQIGRNLHYKKNEIAFICYESSSSSPIVVATGTCIRQSCPVLPPRHWGRLSFINLEKFTSHTKYNSGMFNSFNWLILEFELWWTGLTSPTQLSTLEMQSPPYDWLSLPSLPINSAVTVHRCTSESQYFLSQYEYQYYNKILWYCDIMILWFFMNTKFSIQK